MLATTGLVLSLLGFAATVSATPMNHRVEDIQCRCLSFSTTAAKPTLCSYLDFRGLDWQSAYSLASEHNLKIQFTSQDTISKVLAIPKPLPSSVLASLGRGEALPAPSTARTTKTENKIVCGLGDEVKHIGNVHNDILPGDHYVGLIAAVLMLSIIFYVVGEYICRRYVTMQIPIFISTNFPRRCISRPKGNIQLEGDEKALMAQIEHPTTIEVP